VRWHLVECLATAGVVDDAFIQAQLAHDATDNGKRHVEMARAAHPDGKDAAWEAITRFGEPADVTRMRMQGFMQPDQEEVLEPFRRRYFDQLGPAWDHDHEVGRRFAMAMYPLPHPETIRLTDDYLEADGVPAPIERVLVNGRTRAQRVLDARDGDAAPDQGGSTGGADV
jgi:aminopeptidase N